MMQKITIDVISDVVCPWCYIGKRRLESAIEELKNEFEFEVNYLPFELNPNMPAEGRNQKEYLTTKFGGEERYKQLTDNVTRIASEEGLNFNYEQQQNSPNTRKAHRLIWLAKQESVQGEVKEALLNAYFEKGIDLTQDENLIEVVSAAGLSQEKARTLLSSDEGVVEVEYMEQLNIQRGVSGVPFYIVNNKYGISGAQPSSIFVNALKDISKKELVQ
ncbi:MAG TPA: disulfide bond formation protein DsbA [Cytophagales bacterium]|nr:disulfide bond formation protein DsbA [Cytophagales bacterium]